MISYIHYKLHLGHLSSSNWHMLSGEKFSQINFFQWEQISWTFLTRLLQVKVRTGSVLDIFTEKGTQVISRIKVC